MALIISCNTAMFILEKKLGEPSIDEPSQIKDSIGLEGIKWKRNNDEAFQRHLIDI